MARSRSTTRKRQEKKSSAGSKRNGSRRRGKSARKEKKTGKMENGSGDLESGGEDRARGREPESQQEKDHDHGADRYFIRNTEYREEHGLHFPEEDEELAALEADLSWQSFFKRVMPDLWNILLLLLLYTLQGIPMGLSASVPLILQAKDVSMTEQAHFRWVTEKLARLAPRAHTSSHCG